MNSLSCYAGDSDDEHSSSNAPVSVPAPKLLKSSQFAPKVVNPDVGTGSAIAALQEIYGDKVNLPLVAVSKVPHSTLAKVERSKLPTGTFRTNAGLVTNSALDDAIFSSQYHSYTSKGVTADPSGSGATISRRDSSADVVSGVGVRRKRIQDNDPTSESFLGPWAGFEGESESQVSALESGALTLEQRLIRLDQGLDPYGPGKLDGEALTTAKKRLMEEVAKAKESNRDLNEAPHVRSSVSGTVATSTSENDAKRMRTEPVEEGTEEDMASASTIVQGYADEGARYGPMPLSQCSSTFHGSDEYDYQGVSWVQPPRGLRPSDGHTCYIPKKNIHKYTGHNKGVNSISLFPRTGHLLFSAGLDGKCKVWDVAGNLGRTVKRTYMGHNGAVRELVVSDDGFSFISCSYDNSAKIWDTETGKCIHSVIPGTTPLSAAWNPNENGNVVLLACRNKKVLEFDLRASNTDPSQVYDVHLGPVNTITFFDEGRKFITTSDDRRLLIWEPGVPMPIKEIADTSLHAIQATSMHPQGRWLACQSADNSIVMYSLTDPIGRASRKTFKGHISSGYACKPVFSTDGRFIASGDGEGMIWFWDWATGRVLKKIKAHNKGPAIGLAWHPIQPSWVVSAGWDSVIKLWD